jgi:hypothetical protein
VTSPGWDAAGTVVVRACVTVTIVMAVTAFVVRLLSEPLGRGVFTGEVQVVSTGHRAVIRSGEELLETLQAQQATPAEPSRADLEEST